MIATITITQGKGENVKNEIERLVLLGVPEVANNSQRGAPYFSQPKPKSNQVCFLSDFRNLNRKLEQKPYLMPKTNEMLLKLEDFYYTTSLDLNIGYYLIRLSKKSMNLCTIIIQLKNTVTSVYQQKLLVYQRCSNRR